MNAEQKTGWIVAVCSSPNHGYPTFPCERVVVGPEGIIGDAHSGPMRESFTKPGTQKQNDRPISIVSDEVRRGINETYRLKMRSGAFNEQILVEGLGDLGDVPIGAQVIFSSGVELEVTDRAYPCKKLEEYNGNGLMEALSEERDGEIYTRRGILARVLKTGDLEPGGSVTILKVNQE